MTNHTLTSPSLSERERKPAHADASDTSMAETVPLGLWATVEVDMCVGDSWHTDGTNALSQSCPLLTTFLIWALYDWQSTITPTVMTVNAAFIHLHFI